MYCSHKSCWKMLNILPVKIFGLLNVQLICSTMLYGGNKSGVYRGLIVKHVKLINQKKFPITCSWYNIRENIILHSDNALHLAFIKLNDISSIYLNTVNQSCGDYKTTRTRLLI